MIGKNHRLRYYTLSFAEENQKHFLDRITVISLPTSQPAADFYQTQEVIGYLIPL
jgi:hypothetical protein